MKARRWAAAVVTVGMLAVIGRPLMAEDQQTVNHSGKENAVFDRDSVDGAISVYTEAIRLDPENAAVYCGRGHFYNLKGDRDKAIADYTESIRLNRRHAGAHWGRGCVYAEMSEIDKAVADVTEAIRLDPKCAEPGCPKLAEACCWRGDAFWKLGNLDKAIADYTHAIRFDPNRTEAYCGRAYACGKKGEFDKAIADFTQAIHLNPTDADIYCGRSIAYADKGEFARAVADCDESIRLDPKHVLAYNAAAWLQATCPDTRFRDGQMAIENAKRACKLSEEKDAACIDTLAAAYAENGNFQNACKCEARAIELTKDEQYKKEFRSRLQLYEKRQPYREEKKKR